ncbi:MAG: PIN domain-containing protein [Hyphomicrobiales bacterium]|nr:PIN domain-containing protein [Hyphomicrobiales bacterium]
MTDRVFIDTNVLIYARNATDRTKQAHARHWLQSISTDANGLLNRQVLNELTRWVLSREHSRPLTDIKDEIDALSIWGARPVSQIDVDFAWLIRARFGFQWYDTLLLAAALHADCRFFLTEDMTDGLQIDGMTLINPFRHRPEDILSRD